MFLKKKITSYDLNDYNSPNSARNAIFFVENTGSLINN